METVSPLNAPPGIILINKDYRDDDDAIGDLTDLHLSPNNTMDEAGGHHHSLPTVAQLHVHAYLDNPHNDPRLSPRSAGKRSCTSRLWRQFRHSPALMCALLTVTIALLFALTYSPTSAVNATAREQAAFEYLSRLKISDPVTLHPPHNQKHSAVTFLISPQQNALHWIVHEDLLQLAIPSVDAVAAADPEATAVSSPFVQRYVAAVFVFSLTTLGHSNALAHDNEAKWQDQLHFLSAQHECEWNSPWQQGKRHDGSTTSFSMGFLCNNENQQVTDITLQTIDLHGAIPLELFHFQQLTHLALDVNRITGEVPYMPNLHHLSMAYNNMSSKLPISLGSMTKLSLLRLSENMLQGDLSKSRLDQLTNLKVLALDGNEFVGDLQPIYPLTNLEELYLGFNSLSGTLSNDLFQRQTHLRIVAMNNNRLSGPLPDTLWNLTSLEVVDLHFNALDGPIHFPLAAAEKDTHRALKYFDVSENFFEGGLPPTIVAWSQLTHLDVSLNRMTELLPTNIGALSLMETLLLTDNILGPQPIPDSMRHMTNLRRLSLQDTARTGPLPDWIPTMTNLEVLALDRNRLTGTIASEFGHLTKLKYCMLNQNWLTATVPTELIALPQLAVLLVDNNRLNGTIDTCSFKTHLGAMIADCGDPLQSCAGSECDDVVVASMTIEVTCPCCTSCCNDMDEECNQFDWLNQVQKEETDDYDASRSEEYIFTSPDEKFKPAN
jgi:Leucine-rich repeat (LRR) protein